MRQVIENIHFSQRLITRRVVMPLALVAAASAAVLSFSHNYKLVFVGASDRCIPGYIYVVERGVQPVAGDLAMVHSHQTDLIPAGVPLLKLVVGADGDTVDVKRYSVTANGRTYIAPISQSAEALNISEESLLGGRQVEPNSLFMIGTFPGSYDSRFFGSISREKVVGRAFVLI